MARAKLHAKTKPKAKHTPGPHAPVDLKAYTIPQFCEAYNMSIWTYFRLAKAGEGPETMKVGQQKTLIAIADAEAWQEKRKVVARDQWTARKAKREAKKAGTRVEAAS
jgi:hypothetical protein